MKRVTGLPLDVIEGIIYSRFTLQVRVRFHIYSFIFALSYLRLPYSSNCTSSTQLPNWKTYCSTAQVSYSGKGMLNSDSILDKYIIFQPKTSVIQ